MAQAAAPGSSLPAADAAKRTLLATYALAEDRVAFSFDERFALLRGADGGLWLIELQAATAIPLPEGGPWHAGSFAPVSDQLWLVSAGGTACGFALPPAVGLATWSLGPLGGADRVEIGIPKVVDEAGRPPQFHDLVVAADGAHVAWSMTAGGERLAGVNAVAGGDEIVRFRDVDTAAMVDHGQPWIAFVGDGAHVAVQVRPRRDGASGGAGGDLEVPGHDGPGLLVWSLAEKRAVAKLAPYVARNTPGYALLPDGLALGTRSGTHRWPLLRWRLGATQPTVLLPEARGGHFTDLHVEPRGRVLCEWDFEDDDGIVVIDIEGSRPPRTIAAGHAFVGFARAPTRDEIPASGGSIAGGVLGRAADGTLRRFSWLTGELQMELPLDPRFKVTTARWSQRRHRVLALGHRVIDGKPRETRHEAELWSLHLAGE